MRIILTALLLFAFSSLSSAQTPADDLAFINQMLKQYNSKKDRYELMVEGNIIRLKYGRQDFESFRMPIDNAIAYIGPYSTGGGGSITVYIACKNGMACMNNGFGKSIPLWFKDVSNGVPNTPEVARRTNRWLLSLRVTNAKAQALSAQNKDDETGPYLANDMITTARQTFNNEAALLESMVKELKNYATKQDGNFYKELKQITDESEQLNDRLFAYMNGLASTGKEVSRLYGLEEHQQYFDPLYRLIDRVRTDFNKNIVNEYSAALNKKPLPKPNPAYCAFMAGQLEPYVKSLRDLANRKAPAGAGEAIQGHVNKK